MWDKKKGFGNRKFSVALTVVQITAGEFQVNAIQWVAKLHTYKKFKFNEKKSCLDSKLKYLKI